MQPFIIVVSCLSGGSAKTTTALNLAAMLSHKGKTLAVDFDPQGNLSQWLGFRDLSNDSTIAEAVVPNDSDRLPIAEIIKTPEDSRGGNLFLAPSDYSLSNVEQQIAASPGRDIWLRRSLKPVRDQYQFIVIDTPPAKSILTFNAILAATHLLIPAECAEKGVTGTYNTLRLLEQFAEFDVQVPETIGILPTRDEWCGANRTLMSKAAIEALEGLFSDQHIFAPVKASTVVQKNNHKGLSLQEAGEERLAAPYVEVVEKILRICHG